MLLVFIPFNAFSMGHKVNINNSIDKVVKKYEKNAYPRLQKYFSSHGAVFPPKKITLITYKKEKVVELWVKDKKHQWTHIHDYPLTAYSGHLGPKLKEHDKQIPEGIYQLVNFNPYSKWHLSMMLNYPNEFDQNKGKQDGRKRLGNNIFLHGSKYSVGCLAIGNKAIEELFILARYVGLKNTKVIISPSYMNKYKNINLHRNKPSWLPELYQKIHIALKPYTKRKS